MTLVVAVGCFATTHSWQIGLAVAFAFVTLVVVASYRHNVHADPSGGGDHEVATVNLGPRRAHTRATRAACWKRSPSRWSPMRPSRAQDGREGRDTASSLKVLDSLSARSPARSSTTPRSARRGGPPEVMMVYMSEYVVGHWCEDPLRSQRALPVQSRLSPQQAMMVTSVPWQLRSFEGVQERFESTGVGSVRCGT